MLTVIATSIGKSGLNADQTARRNAQPKEAKERSTVVETNGPSHVSTCCNLNLLFCRSPNE
jgi:hypothetical protein